MSNTIDLSELEAEYRLGLQAVRLASPRIRQQMADGANPRLQDAAALLWGAYICVKQNRSVDNCLWFCKQYNRWAEAERL